MKKRSAKYSIERFVLLSLFFLLSVNNGAEAMNHTLFSGSTTSYSIIVSKDASDSEVYAAKELQSCLERIGSVTMPIRNCGQGKKGKRIIVGYNDDLKELLPAVSKPKDDDEGFIYKNKGGDIVILGGRDRGTMYGVFAFLENEFGCRWYTRSYTKTPEMNEYTFNHLEFSDAPAFPIRNILYSEARNRLFRVHCRFNEIICTQPSKPADQTGGRYSFLGPHTFEFLLSPDDYFEAHPEYYALRKGKRQRENTQPCLSNPEVLRICSDNIRKIMRLYPEIDIYEISTNDNQNYCECDSCQALIRRLGSLTDVALDFANKVALAVEDEFPNKKIEFEAYLDVRRAPVTIKPRHNVVIRIANLEICHVHGFEECETKASRLFCQDLELWSKITDNLNVWDYGTNFFAFNLPYPNFKALQANLQAYKRVGVKGMFIEGNHYTYNGEFQALRIYVLSRLIWNPYVDLDMVVDDFLYGYYSSAAPYMREYYDLVQAYLSSKNHMTPTESYSNYVYRESFISDALDIFEQAKAATSDEGVLHRIEIEELSVNLFYSLWEPQKAIKEGAYQRAKAVLEREQIDLKRKDMKQRMSQIEMEVNSF